ncbi:ATP-binding cassette domain-containing protein [Flavobacteriaceae bacterium Ap0902]|nr:ATP-binding cassette domain-containing protein [Flavobacteriaceae bacterium Ap0902]
MANTSFKRTKGLIGIYKQLIPFIKPYRTIIGVTLFLTLLGALASQVNPLVLKYTVDEVERLMLQENHWEGGLRVLTTISIILFGKEILNIFIQFGQKYYGEKIRISISTVLAQAAVDKILTYKTSFFQNEDHETGKLQTRIDRGVESLTRLVQNFFIDILPLFSSAAIALVIMYSANFYVGLVATLILPIYFWVSQRQANKLRGVRRELRGQRESKSNGLINIIQSILVIKSFNRENYEGTKQYNLQLDLMNSLLYTRKTNFLYDAIKTFLEQIGVVLIILLTVYLVLNETMSLGSIMLHIMLFNNVSAPIRQLHRIYDQMNDALIYAEAYFDILDADDAIEPSGDLIQEKIKGEFELKHVDFAYPNGTKALHDINMIIKPNQTTALVGLSGAGKSTIVNLLCKFYDPNAGEILLDGMNLSHYETDYIRSQIGLVLQKNHIFSGTVMENIRYGKMGASDKEVIEAAKQANLHDQIIDLEDGYEHNANMLSGGQQQRIAIARLFLKNPPIIILDEPTASLDAISTEQIKISLDAIKKDRTVLIISHNLSQIIDADKIYVMEKGSVVENGTHQELYENDSAYRKIFDAAARSMNLELMAETLADNDEQDSIS